jgi:hypothetical protein
MSVIINTKKKIPSERETKTRILSIAQVRGCYPEAKALFDKYENFHKLYQYDPRASFEITKSLIKDLSEIDIYLIAWLCDGSGNILINNVVAFVLEDVPDEKL